MKTLILALAALAAQAETICGAKPTHPHVSYAEVACVDFDALAKHVPLFAGRGQQTQVLIHAKTGEVVAVTVDGKTKYQRIVIDQWGRRVALVSFEGISHQAVAIRVYSEER